MKFRNLLLITVAAVAAALSGCNTADETTAHRKTTCFGLYTYEPECYKPSTPTSMIITTDEACGMELPSGDRTTFFWGGISVQDY